MRNPAWIAFIASLTLLLGHAYGLPIPGISIIPNQTTVNGSFIMIADVPSGEPVAVSWLVPGFGRYGGLPNVNGRYICYFSNTDPKSTCGPSPFTEGLAYDFRVDALASSGDKSTSTISVSPGSISISATLTNSNGTVNILAATQGLLGASVSYEVYSSGFVQVKPPAPLSFNSVTGFYSGTASLPPGEYFFAFTASGGGDYGGSVARHTVAEQPTGGPGSPALQAEATDVDLLVQSGAVPRIPTGRITNNGNATVGNLTLAVPANLLGIMGVTLSNSIIPPLGSAFYTITLQNIQRGADINAKVIIKSGADIVGEIPVRIRLSFTDVTPPPPGESVSVSPESWTGDFLIPGTGGIAKAFTVSNGGSSPITSMNVSGIPGVTIAAPPSIPAGGIGSVTATVNTRIAGPVAGILTFSSPEGSDEVLVAINLYNDVTDDIEAVENGLDAFTSGLSESRQEQLASVLLDIESSISSAKADQAAGRYASAAAKYGAAQAGLNVLQGLETAKPPGVDFDTSLLIPLVGGIAAIIIIVFVVKKLRGRKKGGGMEDEFGEEPPEEEEEEEEL
ncbi:MAG: hypothetical protein HY367_03175 [Candidatus Aenigmarchaeota archaeon]|nr:hypothetical protein [Candidatus Aenigmarchaeota archaeon]